jgi:hypothetical protein
LSFLYQMTGTPICKEAISAIAISVSDWVNPRTSSISSIPVWP